MRAVRTTLSARSSMVRGMALAIGLAWAAPATPQFGHPLKGTWSGYWTVGKESPKRLLLELNWDGKAISGTINPGPNAVALQKAEFDPSAWTIHLEADGKDASGKTVHYVIDGKLENIGAYQRFITGTWTQGTTRGEFKIVRN